MNPDREKELIEQALETPVAERSAFLDAVCEGDPVLRDRLEALLAEHDAPTGDRSKAQADAVTPTMEDHVTLSAAPGSVIGRYKLLEKIGEGGNGEVWAAEQRRPVKRRVAVKIIKLGMDTKQVIARFEAERQALALMDHPNIAKVLDAGATDTGRPYFVMELVRGISVTEYCDQERLSTKRRLDLFIQVSHAIQHAHQKGIIHRDIKPSNILVTLHDGTPVPKVIDFGIAKATQQDLTEKTVYTRFQQFVGTPAYMSPEQAEMSGLDIDTRSDIYSLGVLLYELLTGRTPFDPDQLMKGGIDAMRKAIRELDPPKPSSKVATLEAAKRTTTAARHSVQVPKLMSQLKGDMDWIVMKCLEKDRTRRYDTANGIAMDIHRHLTDEPVVARPPSAAYRLQKAWRRNKVAYAACASVTAAMIIGLTLSAWQARVATAAKETALIAQSEKEIQREKAVAKAEEAERERRRAEQNAEANRANLYVADMQLAQHALDANNLGLASRLLESHRPLPNQLDLRNWEWRYLWSQVQGRELFVLGTNNYNVLGMAISADGRLLASASGWGGGDVRIWDLERNRLLATPVESGAVGSVAISPDEPKTLAFGLQSGEVVLWSILENRETRRIPAVQTERHGDGLAFSADGTYLFIGTGKGTLLTWDRLAQVFRNPVQAHPGGVGSIALTPDGKTLFTSSISESRLFHLDYSANRSLTDIEGIGGSTLAMSPVGDKLSVGDVDGVHVLSLPDGTEIATLTSHSDRVDALAFSDDARLLATGSADYTIRIWDTDTWQEIDMLKGHRNEVSSLVFSPDSQRLYSGGKDKVVRVWRLAQSEPEGAVIPKPLNLVATATSPDGSLFCMLGDDRRAELWDLQSRAKRWEQTLPGDLGYDPPVCISGDGGLLAMGDSKGGLWVLNTLTEESNRLDTADDSKITAVAFGQKGERLLVLRADGLLRSWRVFESVLEWERATGLQRSEGLSLSSEGTRASVNNRNGEIVVINATDGNVLWQWQAHRETIDGMVFFDSGQRLVTCSREATMKIWNLEEKVMSSEVLPTKNAFFGISFSPDRSRLLASTYSGSASLYDRKTWREVLSLDRANFSMFLDDKTIVIGADSWGDQIGFVQAPTWDEIEAAEVSRQREMNVR